MKWKEYFSQSIEVFKMKLVILSAVVFAVCFFRGVESEGMFTGCCKKIDIVFDPKENVECGHIYGGLVNIQFLPGKKPKCAVPVCGDGKYYYKFDCAVGKCNVIE